MAYKNPKTGRIYLRMNMAPICSLHQYANEQLVCATCPIKKIQRNHNLAAATCGEICNLFGDEVATAFGYDIIEAETADQEAPSTKANAVSQKFVIHDSYHYKGSNNYDLILTYKDGMIQLISSYGELMGTASSMKQLIKLLTAITNGDMA